METRAERPLIIGAGTCIIRGIMKQMGQVAAVTDAADLHVSQILPDGRAPIEPDMAARCSILFEEVAPWLESGTLTAEERRHFPENCTRISVPTLHLDVLWPLMTEDPRNVPEPGAPWGRIPYPFGDRIGLSIVKSEPDVARRRAIYDATDLTSVVNLDLALELEVQNCFVREQGCDIRVAAFVMSHFREKQLYYTQGHPTGELLYFILAQAYGIKAVRDLIGRPYSELVAAARNWATHSKPFLGEEAPIHPAVARHFGLQWWTPNHSYRFLGVYRTFDEWIDWYLSYTPATSTSASS